jgi:hypothetical protein
VMFYPCQKLYAKNKEELFFGVASAFACLV